jgi:hypothetical protein
VLKNTSRLGRRRLRLLKPSRYLRHKYRVSYEDAYAAFKRGDFPAALPLLEKAALEAEYTSPALNDAHTLTLYHVGDKPRLADVAFLIANALVATDSASAMDYFQRAIFAGLDATRIRRIGELVEQWVVARPGKRAQLQESVKRVAHVVGCLSPDDGRTQYLKLLVSSLRKQGIESTIFTTEWAANWFFSPADTPQSRWIEIEAAVKIASVEGNFEERAERVAETLRSSGIAAAFFHSNLAEQITARVASMRPIPLQVNVNHDSEMDADLFDGRIHLFENAMRRTRFSSPAEWIPPSSDIESRLGTGPVTHQAMGLESASSVSATFGDLGNVGAPEYLRVLSEIMTRFPKHFHLFAGAGNVKSIRPYLHSQGVLPRVRFLGDVRDIAPLLNMVDVYLAPFPNADWHSILDAMGAGKPIVVLRGPAADLVGIRDLIAPGGPDYIEIADRLLRNPDLRRNHGHAMLDRFRAEFHPDRLGERYSAFLVRCAR